jgi:hypothetical protein
MKIDLHCHSEASWDCITPLSKIADRCRNLNINVQAITDHNEIWGALQLKELIESQSKGESNRLTIIVGEEITTTEGEIIGLFLKEKIKAHLSPEETVEQIKAQGGLVLLPHGFDPLKRGRLKPEARARIASEIDIVETFNARVSLPLWNQRAAEWAQEKSLPRSAGTDAHTLADVGTSWVKVPAQPVHTPGDLLQVVARGTPTGEWTHPVLAFMQKAWDWVRYKL